MSLVYSLISYLYGNSFSGSFLCNRQIDLRIAPGNPALNLGLVSAYSATALIQRFTSVVTVPVSRKKRAITSTSANVVDPITREMLSKCLKLDGDLDLSCSLQAVNLCKNVTFNDWCNSYFEIVVNNSIYENIWRHCDQKRMIAKGNQAIAIADCRRERDKLCVVNPSGRCEFASTLANYIFPNRGQQFSRGSLNNLALYGIVA